jgi:hypothetical protein
MKDPFNGYNIKWDETKRPMLRLCAAGRPTGG